MKSRKCGERTFFIGEKAAFLSFLCNYRDNSCSPVLHDAIDAAYNAGVMVVAAAGNDVDYGYTILSSPATCDNVFAVGASTANNQKASYSQYADGKPVYYPYWLAPGGEPSVDSEILSTFSYGIYPMSGTSMAAPHVSGVLALMKAANPSLTPAQAGIILSENSYDLSPTGWDIYSGFGLINAAFAVAAAASMSAPPIFVYLPTSLALQSNESTATIVGGNVGGGILNISSITDQEETGGNWLTGSWYIESSILYVNLSVNRTGLATGYYKANVTIITELGSFTIPITMQVGTPTYSIGDIWMIAVDTTTGCMNGTKTGYASNYSYSIGALPPGSYYLLAIQDNDADGEFCESGDQCLYYGMDDQFYAIPVDSGMITTGVDISVSKRVAGRVMSGNDSQKPFTTPLRIKDLFRH